MCELVWLLQSDSAMPTGVFSPIKLATDGKVDGNEPIYTFHWPFFLAVGQQLSKDWCFDITFAQAGYETTYLHEMFSWKKPPPFIQFLKT